MTRLRIARQVREDGLVVIMRGDFSLPEQLEIAEALVSGGVGVLEITLNTRDALAGIRQLRERFSGELLVGAGTVRTPADAQAAIGEGAQLLVCPNLDLGVVALAAKQDVLVLPGVFTASEAQAAYSAGCSLVKLFPADALGPEYLKALRAPLDNIGFVPTGGITVETIGAFHRAGAVAFGIGSSIVKNVPYTAEEGRAIASRARKLREALQTARARP